MFPLPFKALSAGRGPLWYDFLGSREVLVDASKEHKGPCWRPTGNALDVCVSPIWLS